LNQSGLRTKQGAPWSDFAVGYVLRNPVYTGQVAWQRVMAGGKRGAAAEPIRAAGAHEPLVDPGTFAAVQALLARRRREGPAAGGAAVHALTGLAVCARCGGPVHGVVQRCSGGAGERLYYRCSRREHQGGCDLPYLPGAALERRVLEALGAPGPPERLAEAVRALAGRAPGPSRPAPAAELARLDRARRRWDEAYEAGDISRAEWKAKTEALQARIAALPAASAPLEAPESLDALAHAMADVPGLWPHLTPAERKTVLSAFVARITVDAGGVICLAKVTL
jgi:site-specific DNA recombinase